jgi:hypothetical protein
MAIEDSNPERRNLVVLSMAIIAFYVGGCEITDGVIELPLIKLKFTDPYHLAFLVWVMLFWFAFRYWVQHSAEIGRIFRSEISGESYLNGIVRLYFLKKINSIDRSLIGRNPIRWHLDRDGINWIFYYESNEKNGSTRPVLLSVLVAT